MENENENFVLDHWKKCHTDKSSMEKEGSWWLTGSSLK